MTPGESEFVEEMGQFLASLGMTPMAGRMWGWLLICEPPEQTAGDIAAALQASRGAISGTARILAHAGLIRRGTKPGDRKEYFSAPPEALDQRLLVGQLDAAPEVREVVDRLAGGQTVVERELARDVPDPAVDRDRVDR